MKHIAGSKHLAALALSAVLATGLAGCNKSTAIDDNALMASVQKSIAGDAALATQTIQVASQEGIVTLSGGVDSMAARSLAARDAASIPGVVKVVNALTVSGEATPTTIAAAPTPIPIRPEPGTIAKAAPAPAPRKLVAPPPTREIVAAPITRTPAPAPVPAPPPPAPKPSVPPPPVARTVTLPAGSALPIRITQTLDSATTQPGDTFSGAIATDIVVDGMVMIPRGAPVTGSVTEVHEAAHFKGSSLLTIQLTSLTSRGQRIDVATDPYSVKGKGRGENTAVKAGVGAAAGAILGGIFGGGKGAAIGAAAGGGTGAGINAVTRGQQVQIPSETIVRFATTSSITTRTTVHAGNSGSEGLQDR